VVDGARQIARVHHRKLVRPVKTVTTKYGLMLTAPPVPPTPKQPPPGPPPPSPPPPPVPNAPNAPAIEARTETNEAWVSWEQFSYNGANWYAGFEGSNAALFTASSPFAAYSGQPGTSTTFGLTNGANQAAALIINAGNGEPFARQTLCGPSYKGFSLTYAFSITAGSASYNGIADGVTLSFIDASEVASAATVKWVEDVNGMLVPASSGAVTLQVGACACACACRRAWTRAVVGSRAALC
jgi:hypothetical protein